MRSPDVDQRFGELLSIMARLRAEGGCPWDREQTRESLRPFLIEEAHEVLEAIDAADPSLLREELGDLLFQVVFHARIAEERGEFTMGDVLVALADKMIRRHPHVFGDRRVESAAQALSQWEAIKRAEGGPGRSALHGIPKSLPALLRAQRVQHRASRVGFDWQEPMAALVKVEEELGELTGALRERCDEAVRAEIGDLLFAVVNVARLAGADPDSALRAAVDRFQTRFQRMEDAADHSGRELRSLTLEEMERLWAEAKAQERRSASISPGMSVSEENAR
jgi:tetrapyrrole methylase family protein/MazG family protein